MTICGLVNTNEPRKIKDMLCNAGAIDTPLDGYDVELYTERGTIPIERKEVPNDFLASITDGRLIKEIIAMRQVSEFYIVLLHGEMIFDRDDNLVIPGLVRSDRYMKYRRQWSRKAIKNLIRSIAYAEGAFVEVAENDSRLVEVIEELQDYFNDRHHLSLRKRPSIQTDWLIPTERESVRYFYAGIPGIKTMKSAMLEKKFPVPSDLLTASKDDIMSIDGFGESTANRICEFIQTGKVVK
jgi:ERCC4-type nuclease